MRTKCAHCSADGEIELNYFGKRLCNQCFLHLMEKRILKNIRQNHLIKKGDKLAVAISGGKDSISLLHFLNNYCSDRKISLLAIYIDRGDEFSNKSIDICKNNCNALNIDFHVFSFEEQWGLSMKDIIFITDKVGANRCSVCGVLRRRLLDIKARELGCNKLATGHNLTDEAQTYLMNFVKGELSLFANLGPKSLPARKGFVQRIKPLRAVPENEMKIYADLKNYTYLPEPCPCRQGSLRFNFMNYLEDIKTSRPGAEFSIVNIGDEVSEVLRSKKTGQPNKCKLCGELCAKELCRVCQYLKLK